MDLSNPNNMDDLETDDGTVALENKFRFKECPVVEGKCSYRDPKLDSGLDSLHSVEEKRPVQCTDECDSSVLPKSTNDNDNAKLPEKLKHLSLKATDDQDEGIYSISAENSLNAPLCIAEEEIIEVDLNETDKDGDTLIHTAILMEMFSLAGVLIDMADEVSWLNIQNLLRQSPLHLAVLMGQTDIVQKLVNKGVNVSLRDHQGNTPLHIACRRGDRDAVQIIVKSFGDDEVSRKKYLAMKNCEGLTCLHVAAECKQYLIMGHLFLKGANVNMGDAKSGRTVLHYAVERRDIETVILLLTHSDIDVDCKTFKGETPLVIAYWRNYTDILKKLKSKGAYFSYDIVEEPEDDVST